MKFMDTVVRWPGSYHVRLEPCLTGAKGATGSGFIIFIFEERRQHIKTYNIITYYI